jgi:hypothetical protein
MESASLAVEPASTAEQCALQAACFNSQFQCGPCCSTGRSADGTSCWDALYTHGKCCRGPMAANVALAVPTISSTTTAPAQLTISPVSPAVSPAIGADGRPVGWRTTQASSADAFNTPVKVVTPAVSACVDELPTCRIWAVLGECSTTAQFMSDKCCLSCQSAGRRAMTELLDSRGQPKAIIDSNGRVVPLPYFFNSAGEAIDSRGHPAPRPPAQAARVLHFPLLLGGCAGLALVVAAALLLVHHRKRIRSGNCESESGARQQGHSTMHCAVDNQTQEQRLVMGHSVSCTQMAQHLYSLQERPAGSTILC